MHLGNYIERQVKTWSKQYKLSETHTIPAMERLMEWLPEHLPTNERTTVVHGDFRLEIGKLILQLRFFTSWG